MRGSNYIGRGSSRFGKGFKGYSTVRRRFNVPEKGLNRSSRVLRRRGGSYQPRYK
jgi:hypothetical protein